MIGFVLPVTPPPEDKEFWQALAHVLGSDAKILSPRLELQLVVDDYPVLQTVKPYFANKLRKAAILDATQMPFGSAYRFKADKRYCIDEGGDRMGDQPVPSFGLYLTGESTHCLYDILNLSISGGLQPIGLQANGYSRGLAIASLMYFCDVMNENLSRDFTATQMHRSLPYRGLKLVSSSPEPGTC